MKEEGLRIQEKEKRREDIKVWNDRYLS